VAKPSLWQLSVVTSTLAEDAVAVLFQAQFGVTPVIQTDTRTGITRVSAYLKERCAKAQLAELQEGLDAVRDAISQTFPRAKKVVATGKFIQKKIRSEDWAHSWKKHFHPIDVGSELLIKPPWSKRKGRAGQAVVVLNPGLSFGTGQHPTTSYCLTQLVVWRTKLAAKGLQELSCLDIGTGSGILAISAYKLGYRPVDAFDFDPQAVMIARKNARSNRVKIAVSQQDVLVGRKSGRRYDVVCANLMIDVLLAAKEQILGCLRTPGVLVVAGLLRTQFPAVRQAYESAGLKFIGSKSEKEWTSGVFLRES
jgi:ribosomal protein L11 methyltransferase